MGVVEVIPLGGKRGFGPVVRPLFLEILSVSVRTVKYPQTFGSEGLRTLFDL